MTMTFSPPRRSALASDVLARLPVGQAGYDHPDRSFSPFWSNIGLTFGNAQGVEAVQLHYNRRTIALAGLVAEVGKGAVRTATPLGVRDQSTTTAFFATDSFLVQSSAPLRLAIMSDPALRLISEAQDANGIRQIHAMITTLDPRDPDREVPVLISIRLLAGAFGGDKLIPDTNGELRAAVRLDILTLDRKEAAEALMQCPATLPEAEALCQDWLATALGDLSLTPETEAEAQVLGRAVLTLLFNTTAAPGMMAGRLASYPSRGGYPTHFLWDACFHMLALEDMAPQLARDALLLISDTMRADGLMAHFICSTWIRPDASQPALFGWAAERLVTRTGDMDLAAEVLPAMQRNTQWWLSQRMTAHGLIACFDPFETGWDDTPRLDHGPIIACDMNAYVLMQMRSAARLATLLERHAEAATTTAEADAFAQRMVDVLYDPQTNRFHDMLLADGSHLPILSPAVFLPLLGDMPLPRDKQVQMLEAGLFDPGRLYGAIPFPCVAYDDPAYDPEQMWRGPMWPPIYWLLLEVMDKFDLADQRRESAAALYQIILKDGNLHEYFHSQTGRGLGFPQQGWTAAIFLRLHADLTAGTS